MSKVVTLIAAANAAGIPCVILYPILGVTLWVSFLVAACVLVLVGLTSVRPTAH
jgi:hypothetical protein